jgi:beta-galactosidase
LNRRLLTVSYGHEYTAWNQIDPRINIHGEGDAVQVPLALETKRFFSLNMVRFLEFQAKILRAHTTHQFVTHNAAKPSTQLFDLARNMDFLAEDLYPQTGQFAQPGFFTDLFRGANRGKSFQVFEMRSGTFGSYTLNDATPPPGLIRLWAWQTIAHGSDGVLFFRWRRNNAGSEPYWQGLLDQEGAPALPYREVAQMGSELREHGARFAQASSPAQVAGVVSYDSDWAINIGHKDYPYLEQLGAWTQAFRRLQMNVDLVEPGADLTSYKIVFAPALYIVDDSIAKWLEAFVSRGGTLILGPRAGFANEDNVGRHLPPGLLAPLAKVQVETFTPLGKPEAHAQPAAPASPGPYKPAATNLIRPTSREWPGPFSAGVWADILTLSGGQALYTYTEDFYAGRPAITLAETGKGKTLYIGTLLEESFYLAFAEQLCRTTGISCGPILPEAVDFAARQNAGGLFRFFLNFSTEIKTVPLDGSYRDLLSGKRFTGTVDVPPLDLRILTEP